MLCVCVHVSSCSLPGKHDWLSWRAIGVGQLSARGRREIHHREGSCLSLALDKWAQMKSVCACRPCVQGVDAVVGFLRMCACTSWQRSIAIPGETHGTYSLLGLQNHRKGYSFFVIFAFWRGGRSKRQEEVALCFLRVCIMDEECPRCSISSSLMAEGSLLGLPKTLCTCVLWAGVCVTMTEREESGPYLPTHIDNRPHSFTVFNWVQIHKDFTLTTELLIVLSI